MGNGGLADEVSLVQQQELKKLEPSSDQGIIPPWA
jgi:hypothetical protein